MSNKHCDSTSIDILIDLIDDLGIKRKDAFKFLDVGESQFYNWQRKGRVPNKNYWAFQKAIASYLQEELIRKLYRIGIIEKEFLQDLIKEGE